jgi:DNA-binding NarL/FixJ family response regulator
LSAAEVDRLVERYAEIRSLRLLALEFKVDRSTARGHLRDRHVDLVPPASMTLDQVTAAIALYAEGKSSAAIGRSLGCSNKTVLKELRAAGITIRPQVGRRS